MLTIPSRPPAKRETLTAEAVAENLRSPLYSVRRFLDGVWPSRGPEELSRRIAQSASDLEAHRRRPMERDPPLGRRRRVSGTALDQRTCAERPGLRVSSQNGLLLSNHVHDNNWPSQFD